ncbi:hypothetical protein ACGFSI_41090 [Streptomyces virginiae]
MGKRRMAPPGHGRRHHSTTKSRRDKLTADQLAALAKLGVDWA